MHGLETEIWLNSFADTEDVCICRGDLAWFPKGKKKAYIILLPVSVPVTHFNSLSNVFQAGQMGGDLSDPKIV